MSGFDAALAGRATALLDSDGRSSTLPARRWRRPADADDAWLLDRCQGPTVDLGCGPGRLLVALARHGVVALGVDHSPVARAHCRRRGVAMVLRDVFTPLPGEGGWRHALLADGNIGIGGDPAALLARSARLLTAGGTVLVEVDPDPTTDWRGTVQVHGAGGLGPVTPWARVGVAALRQAGQAAGLTVVAERPGARAFAELRADAAPARDPGPTDRVRRGRGPAPAAA